jgi:hypothetical protein
MTESIMPKNALDWAEFLNRKTLPSPFRVGDLVLSKLAKEPLSYAQLAHVINRDPVLSFSIFSRAKKDILQNSDKHRTESKTLAHAISIIGLEGLKDVIASLPKKAVSPKNITSFYYLRNLSISLYAGALAKAISERKHKGNAEDIYWSSLFLGAPLWHLWRYATPEMRLVRYAIRSNFKLPETAEREVLGDSLKNITQACASALALPQIAQECYLPEHQPSNADWVKIAHCVGPEGIHHHIEDIELKLKMQQPHFVVMLANLLAHYASYCWYARASLRAQRILAYYLNCSLDEAISFSHQVAVDMSRQHALPGVMSPAAKLLIPPRKRTKAKQKKNLAAFQESVFDTRVLPAGIAISKPTANAPEPNVSEIKQSAIQTKADNSVDSNKPAADSIADQRSHSRTEPIKPDEINLPRKNPLFEELTRIMVHHPQEFSDFHELMNAATQGIAYGIDLKRAFVALISKDGSRIKTYYTVGCTEFETIRNFESQIFSDTLFRKLCERPASIWIKPTSEKKIQQLVPVNFKRAIDVGEFFMMSVFVGNKPVAIFYADNQDKKAMTPADYQQFKFLCGAVSSALIYQAKATKK